MSHQHPELYTDPELRERLKNELMASDKGGKPGQWSARKSQFLVKEYEKAGGGYTQSKRAESQKELMEWTDEEWTTSDGKIAIRGDHTERYLPREAWDLLSDKEKREANASKEEASEHGEQFVDNTDAVKRVMKQIKENAKG